MKSKLEDFEWLESRKLGFSWRTLVWQLFGAIGELVFKRPPPIIENASKQYLNLGAGDDSAHEFVNADFYRLHKWFSKGEYEWMVDLNKPLKCQDNYWDGIVLSHVNEHLSYISNYRLLVELFRTLKPGGTLRLVMPDLQKYLSFKYEENDHPKMNRYNYTF